MSAFLDAQTAIVTKLEQLGELYKFDTFEISLPPGYATEYENKAPLPYVLYTFGGKGAAAFTDQGITGTRDDMKWSLVIFEIVAPDPVTIRVLTDIVRDAFSGYVPDPTWGELVERYYPQYTVEQPHETEFWPQRYNYDLVFVADVDA